MHGQTTNVTNAVANSSYFCDGAGESLLLPLFNEASWSVALRAGLYFAALVYVFGGIAVATDVFMNSIEKIVSQTVLVKDVEASKDGDVRYKSVPFWNPTVATLTLGAAGTCSPEVLLTIIEVVATHFDGGSLGPGTIIGSSAFNLLITTACCVVAVPSPETRRIIHTPVYVTLIIVRTLAYMWIMFVLAGTSAKAIEIWEAIVTLAFFVVLVCIGYAADKNVCRRRKVGQSPSAQSPRASVTADPSSSTGGLRDIERQAAILLRDISPTEVSKWVSKKLEQQRQEKIPIFKRSMVRGALTSSFQLHAALTGNKLLADCAFVEFATKFYSMTENERTVQLRVMRRGNLKHSSKLFYEVVVDADASTSSTLAPPRHARQPSVFLTLLPNETERIIEVEPPRPHMQPGDSFLVRLFPQNPTDATVRIGEMHPAEVTIADEKEADECELEFKEKRLIVKECDEAVRIRVVRRAKMRGVCAVEFTTKDATAKAGVDFVAKTGKIVFDSGESEEYVDIPLINTAQVQKSVNFKVILTDAIGGVVGEKSTTTVTITSDDAFGQKLVEANKIIQNLLAESRTWQSAWRKQFVKAMNVNDGDISAATTFDYCTHTLLFVWKTLFACIPPPELLGGYITFLFSLIVVGVLIAIIEDMCEIFGCLVGLDPVIIGITLVSVGTNLPDLFASKIAAIQDKTADMAMLHINGSICVNVFLGLGLPWLIGSVYNDMKGKQFEIPSDDLWWCVVMYCVLSLLSTGILLLRRKLKFFGQAEFGGPKWAKIGSAIVMVLLWVLYVALSWLQSKSIIPEITF